MNGYGRRQRRATEVYNIAPEPVVRRPKKPKRMQQRQELRRQSSWANKGARRSRRAGSSGKRVRYRDSDDEGDLDSEEEEYELAEQARKRAQQQQLCQAMAGPGTEGDYEIERAFAHREKEGVEASLGDPWRTREICVKWQRRAYRHATWEAVATLENLGGFKRVQNYMKKVEERERTRMILRQQGAEDLENLDVEAEMELQLVEQHKRVERVVGEMEGSYGESAYLVKWKGLPYKECTWETAEAVAEAGSQAEVDFFQAREQRAQSAKKSIPRKVVQEKRQELLQAAKANKGRPFVAQPEWIGGEALKMRDYQLDGLNFMALSWCRNNNCILADEMGLGKTIQCVSVLAFLKFGMQLPGPCLVVVPLSTISNWAKDMRKWTPDLNFITYVGDQTSRSVIKHFEFYNLRGTPKFDVLLTTPQMAARDKGILRSFNWSYLCVDEAHSLKNSEAQFYTVLKSIEFDNCLLITGTPLQNSLKELWALLHFIEPEKFDNCEEFEEAHAMDEGEGIKRLHEELHMYLIRRVVKEVERSLPPKSEKILRVAMSPLQKKYYKFILSRNFKELNKGVKGSGQSSLLNIVVELKKCCNHPFLFESAENEFGKGRDDKVVDRLVLSSGKLHLLDRLLKRLKETGHRVLIFSQMVRMLDILSDYCKMRGFQYQRLTGSTSTVQRTQAMDHFNAPNSEDFIFLLSTRAGGLGINLATADTVIIFDSDWNPQNDLQAMSRAHRIGQKDTVNIYRFVTKSSVEEDILERAKQKMVLDQLVIQQMDTSGRTVLSSKKGKIFNAAELQEILKFGAGDLFQEKESEDEEKAFAKSMEEEDIDSILARAEKLPEQRPDKETGANALLSQFKVAEVGGGEGADEKSFWERLIPEADRPVEEEVNVLAPLPDRAAKKADISYAENDMMKAGQDAGDDGDWRDGGRKRKGKAAAGAPVVNALHRIDNWPRMQPLTKSEARDFLQAVKTFGGKERLPEIAAAAGGPVAAAPPEAQLELYNILLSGCDDVLDKQEQQQKQGGGEDAAGKAILDFFGAPVKAEDLIARVKGMRALRKRVENGALESFRLPSAALPRSPAWSKNVGWLPKDDAMLLWGINSHGFGSWEKIRLDPSLGLELKIAPEADELSVPSKADIKQISLRSKALIRKLQEFVARPAGFTKPKAKTRREKVADAMDPVRQQMKKLLALNTMTAEEREVKGKHFILDKTKKYLITLGDHIAKMIKEGLIKETEEKVAWRKVREVSKNSMTADKLAEIYQKLKVREAEDKRQAKAEKAAKKAGEPSKPPAPAAAPPAPAQPPIRASPVQGTKRMPESPVPMAKPPGGFKIPRSY